MVRKMSIAGLILMGVGTVGVCGATMLEWITGEPIYKIMMKIFPLIFAIGCFLYWVLAGG